MAQIKLVELNEDEMNALKKYEQIFDNINKHNSVRGISINMSKEIASIIDKDRKRNYNWGCSSCIFALYKRASKIYEYNIELNIKREEERKQAEEEEKQKKAEAKKKNSKKIDIYTGKTSEEINKDENKKQDS